MSNDYLIPLGATAAITANTAPLPGVINRYDASSAPRTPTLPALSGLRVGAVYGVERIGSGTNTVTVSRAGSDTFDDSATSLILSTLGPHRLQVVLISGTKFWKDMDAVAGTGGGGLSPNSPITGATNTKITYDSKGLVTAGTPASSDDLIDGTTYVRYSLAEKSKVATVAINASANSPDATLLNRANHIGSQLANTISDFNAAVDARLTAAQGVLVSPQTGTYTLAATDFAKAVELTDTTAPTNVAVGTPSNGGSTTTVDVPIPAGVVQRNVIGVALYVEGNPTPAVTGVPSGFVEAPDSPVIVSATTQSHHLHVYYKRQGTATGAGETTGNYTFTIAAGLTWRRGAAFRFQGAVREGNPWEVTASAVKTTTTDGLSPPVTDTSLGDNRMWLWVAAKFTAATSTTTASGFTEIVDTADGLSAWVGVQPVAGSPGSLQATFSTNGASSAWLGAMVPGLTVTLPANATNPLPVGFYAHVSAQGSSAVTLEAENTAVNVRGASSVTTRAQYSELTVRKRATDSWFVTGDSL